MRADHLKPRPGYLVFLTVLLMLVSIINIADKELLAPVVDAVKLDLGLNDTQVGSVRSAVFIAALLGQLFWGPLSDRWVRKYIITIGTLIWSGITWMTAYAATFPQLLFARAGMSFAEGCFNPSAFALITDEMPKRRHGLVLGLMSLTYPVGTAAALVVASLIGTQHWRQPFIIYGVIGLGLGILVYVFIREPQRGASEEVVQERGAEYVGRFSFQEFHRMLRVPSLTMGFALDTCQATVNWSFAFWAPTYLTRYHIAPNAEAAALALLPAILGFVCGAVIGGWYVDRLKVRMPNAPVLVALTAMGGGFIMALIVFSLFDLKLLMMAAFFLGLVTYMVMPAVNVIFFSVVTPETKATTISASNVILNSVIAVLTFIIGVVSDATELRYAFGGVVILMYALGVLVCLALLKRFRRDALSRDEMVTGRVISVPLDNEK